MALSSSAVGDLLCISSIGARGKSAFLLKDSSKGKRKRHEMEEVKEEEQALNRDKQQYLRAVKRLKQDNDEMEQQMIELNQFKNLY